MINFLYQVYDFFVKQKIKRIKNQAMNEYVNELKKFPCVTPHGVTGRMIKRLEKDSIVRVLSAVQIPTEARDYEQI